MEKLSHQRNKKRVQFNPSFPTLRPAYSEAEKVKHDSDKGNKNETQEKVHHAQKKRACKIIR